MEANALSMYGSFARKTKTHLFMFVFGALARNVGLHLPRNLPLLSELAEKLAHNKHRIVIYHNDSTDGTLTQLINWQQSNPNVIVLDTHDSRSRMEILSQGRNVVLQAARSLDAEYLVLVDMDESFPIYAVNHIDSLKQKLQRDDWDVLTFGRKDLYYDAYALRTTNDPDDCWGSKLRGSTVRQLQLKYTSLVKQLEVGELYPVLSAFCGFAMYRVKSMEGCAYSTQDMDGNETCEHVCLHETMRLRNNARIRIANVEVGD